MILRVSLVKFVGCMCPSRSASSELATLSRESPAHSAAFWRGADRRRTELDRRRRKFSFLSSAAFPRRTFRPCQRHEYGGALAGNAGLNGRLSEVAELGAAPAHFAPGVEHIAGKFHR